MTNNPEKKQNESDSRAIERFEALVLELNRAVFQFGLFLPPLVMWEEAFRPLNQNEIQYTMNLLHVIYNHVHHPELLFSNFYIASERWKEIKEPDPKNDTPSTDQLEIPFDPPIEIIYNPPSKEKDQLDHMFDHRVEIMDKPLYIQTAFYYKRISGLGELMRLYREYLANLRDSLGAIAWEMHKLRIATGFVPERKVVVGYGFDKLEEVADFLIKEGCIEESSKTNFLAMFENVFMKNDALVRWIKRTDSHAINVTFLKEVFVLLGVDMEDPDEREHVASFFCDIKNESLVIRSRGSRPTRSKELEAFSSKLDAILKSEHRYKPKYLIKRKSD